MGRLQPTGRAMLAVWFAMVVLASTGVVPPSVAGAQDSGPDEDTLQLARELYESGVRAAEAERWTDAADAFARSHDTVPTLPALANLLRAQMTLDRFVAARRSARRLLERDDLGADTRAWAERTVAEADARIARIRVTGLEDGEPARLSVDGADVDPERIADGRVELEVDPGPRAVVVERAGQPARVFRLELDRGESRTLHVLPPPSLDPRETRHDAPHDAPGPLEVESTPVWSEPVFWIVAGGTVLLVGAAVVLALVLAPADDQRLEPRTEVVFPL